MTLLTNTRLFESFCNSCSVKGARDRANMHCGWERKGEQRRGISVVADNDAQTSYRMRVFETPVRYRFGHRTPGSHAQRVDRSSEFPESGHYPSEPALFWRAK